MIIISLSTGVCIFLLVALIGFLHKVWWTPIRIHNIMRSQGINGPAYKFLHGNTKEIIQMREESIGNAMDFSSHDVFPRIMPHIHAWKKLYGKNYLIWHGPQAQLVVTESELIKEILNNKDGKYLKGRLDVFSKKLIGDGILVTEGEKWSKLRKIANHAFYAESLKGMIPATIASVETMLERWRQNEEKEIDVYKEFRLLTAEVISRTAFGNSYLEGENIFDMLTKLGMIAARNGFRIRFPGMEKFFKLRDDLESDKIEQAIRESIIGMIDKRAETMRRGEENNYGSDFLGSLIKANHDPDEKNRISIDDMVDECKTFYLAGQETTNGVLAWSIFLLAIHKDWQEKARKEVIELFGHENPNPEGIARLKTMSMILNETLRLYSPVINLLRRVEREVRLGKLIIPANTEFYLPLLALHHDPEIWGQDVHLFKPERFAEGVAKATSTNITGFIPFGFGPRMCVGLNFAVNEAKIALSMILQRYQFTLSPNYVHDPIQILIVCPQKRVQIVLSKL
ncbi:cytochrome P450 CYP749A22-like [Rhododendron vialii]|uniref:cytochrome P450 CYP749A22-like n=1 Tax=Rhododendron vialii TaxID=182163 RepID=UPI00265F607B|nr:cytochrome P450 CYP749A22-like [Rhododendron vialii]